MPAKAWPVAAASQPFHLPVGHAQIMGRLRGIQKRMALRARSARASSSSLMPRVSLVSAERTPNQHYFRAARHTSIEGVFGISHTRTLILI